MWNFANALFLSMELETLELESSGIGMSALESYENDDL